MKFVLFVDGRRDARELKLTHREPDDGSFLEKQLSGLRKAGWHTTHTHTFFYKNYNY